MNETEKLLEKIRQSLVSNTRANWIQSWASIAALLIGFIALITAIVALKK